MTKKNETGTYGVQSREQMQENYIVNLEKAFNDFKNLALQGKGIGLSIDARVQYEHRVLSDGNIEDVNYGSILTITDHEKVRKSIESYP